MESRAQELKAKIKDCLMLAKESMKEKDKEGAILLLKRKKLLEKQIPTIHGNILNLEMQITSLEAAAQNAKMMECLGESIKVLATKEEKKEEKPYFNTETLSDKEFHAKYEVKEKLGDGSFATVKRVVNRQDKTEYAVKVTNQMTDAELKEIQILMKVDHQHCVKLHETYKGKENAFLVMEIMMGGELFDRIVSKGNFSEKEASHLSRTMLECLEYLHKNGIVHRDLKPENFLYSSKADDAALKLSDFGLAAIVGTDQTMDTACGTPGYVAPEVLKGKAYGSPVDIWSFGVILYVCLCGFPPFYDENVRKLYSQIKRGAYDFPSPYWDNVSEDAKDVVKKCLCVDTSKRFTAKQLLQHPWVKGEDASDKPLGGDFIERLQILQSKRRLRHGVHSIIAINRFLRSIKPSDGRSSVFDPVLLQGDDLQG